MHAGRSHAHQDVAQLDLGAVDEPGFLHHAGGEAGNVVFAVLVHPGHFGRFSSHEGAAGLAATLGHPRHNGFHLGGNVVPQGHIIQENQGFGPLGENVVDAHGHGIDADAVVPVHCERNLELGAHAVGTAHQDRFLHIQGGEVKHAAKRANVAHRARAGGGSYVLLDAPHHLISGFQVHAGGFVRFCHISLR